MVGKLVNGLIYAGAVLAAAHFSKKLPVLEPKSPDSFDYRPVLGGTAAALVVSAFVK